MERKTTLDRQLENAQAQNTKHDKQLTVQVLKPTRHLKGNGKSTSFQLRLGGLAM